MVVNMNEMIGLKVLINVTEINNKNSLKVKCTGNIKLLKTKPKT